jgi:hypothetical protein
LIATDILHLSFAYKTHTHTHTHTHIVGGEYTAGYHHRTIAAVCYNTCSFIILKFTNKYIARWPIQTTVSMASIVVKLSNIFATICIGKFAVPMFLSIDPFAGISIAISIRIRSTTSCKRERERERTSEQQGDQYKYDGDDDGIGGGGTANCHGEVHQHTRHDEANPSIGPHRHLCCDT